MLDGRARHPQRAVLHLLAQLDQEGVVVGQLEAAPGQLADQGRRFEARLEAGPDHGELAQHGGDFGLGGGIGRG